MQRIYRPVSNQWKSPCDIGTPIITFPYPFEAPVQIDNQNCYLGSPFPKQRCRGTTCATRSTPGQLYPDMDLSDLGRTLTYLSLPLAYRSVPASALSSGHLHAFCPSHYHVMRLR